MNALLARLWALCLLRAGPQDLPYSIELTRNLVLANVSVDLLTVALIDIDQSLGRVLLALALLLVVPWLLLSWRGRMARYAQTLAALAGSGMLFSLLLLPLSLLVQSVGVTSADQIGPLEVGATLIGFVLLAWMLMVRAHIVRHALELPRLPAAIVAILWFIAEMNLSGWVFGSTA